MRIGILGGTFNPPHLGHLVCAQEAYRELALDSVLMIPAAIPPHKPVEHEPGAQHRLELCRLAAADDERFEVSDIELRRDGPSLPAKRPNCAMSEIQDASENSATQRALHQFRSSGSTGSG